jgi:hypothetical protein
MGRFFGAVCIRAGITGTEAAAFRNVRRDMLGFINTV